MDGMKPPSNKFRALERTIYPDHALPLIVCEREGLITNCSAATREALQEAGYPVIDFEYRLTSDSRQSILIPIVCRDADVAARRPSVLVQNIALAVGRRSEGATWCAWDNRPHLSVRINGSGQFIQGTVEDGRYREYANGRFVREWLIEYSHGEFTFNRIVDVVRRHGNAPQLWLTPSPAHAEKIARAFRSVTHPQQPPRRVRVVDWTGETYARQ